MKFEIKRRWTNEVAFVAEIEATESTSHGEKMCLAVKWAMAAGIALSGLVLDGGFYKDFRFEDRDFVRCSFVDSEFVDSEFVRSDFDDSDFVRCSFVRSRFVDSDFERSSFEDSRFEDSRFVRCSFVRSRFDTSTLRPFKADLWLTLTLNQSEVPALLQSLKAGKIDGSQYEGKCSCLKGTIATARGVDYRTLSPNTADPAELWFMNIKQGDTPQTNFSSKLAVEWCEEWCALNGVVVPELKLAGQ